METVQVRDAKARLSELVAAAERGEPTTITRHGRPAAVLVPVESAKQLYPEHRPSFVDVLLDFPGGVEFDRDPTPLRDIDL
jgi:prevent-host-death family protein